MVCIILHLVEYLKVNLKIWLNTILLKNEG